MENHPQILFKMSKIRLIKILSLLVMFIGISSWGFLAHKTLQQVSILQLPKDLGLFYYANQDYIVQNSVRPDLRRNYDKTEDNKHYLDMDAPVFGPNYRTDIPHDYAAAIKKYSFDSLKKEGIVPWEISHVYGLLVHAFKYNLRDSVLFYSADLGHYVSDAHVPLHTTANHDGQLTGQKGVHVLWESLVPEDMIQTYSLNKPARVAYIRNPQDFAFQIILESHAMLPELFRAETDVRNMLGEQKSFVMVEKSGKKLKYFSKDFIHAYGERLGASIEDRMLTAANRVASFWFSAWKDAGSPKWVLSSKEIDLQVKSSYSLDQNSWKSNLLIKDKKLISLQPKVAE